MMTFEQAQEIVDRLFANYMYDPKYVGEYIDFWYFPVGEIGSLGLVIDKADGHLNILGSAFPLEYWLWGHRRGFKHDTYDLVITKINNFAETVDFIYGIGLHFPTVNSNPTRCYKENQVIEELKKSKPIFEDQRLGLKIPDFREIENAKDFEYELIPRSCENEGCAPELSISFHKRPIKNNSYQG